MSAQTVAVDGPTAALSNGEATWSLSVAEAGDRHRNIKNSTGQTAYSGPSRSIPAQQNFSWDGRGNNGCNGRTAITR